MRNAFGLLSCLGLLVGCSGNTNSPSTPKPVQESSSPPAVKKLRIAVIPKGTTHVFWKSVHAGAEQAAKEAGVDILWKGPLLENDRDGQINVVQDFISSKVDGICLAPLDKQALIGPVNEAVEAHIPVVIFDSALQDESKIVTYVATDNHKAGELAAQHMAHSLGGKGNVILLRYNPGSESTELREDGFLEALKSQYRYIKILSSDQYAGTTPELSLDNAIPILNKYRDDVNGIFAVCEPNASGILMALKETQLAGKVKFIAFDPSEDLIRAMTDGSCDGIILQDPVKMGYLAVMSMVKSIRGEPVEKRISTGEFLATPSNMYSEQIKKLLHPEQF